MTQEATKYEDILNVAFDEIPVPKFVPNGGWGFICRGASFKPASEEGKSHVVNFMYQPEEPMEDVDSGELEALGDFDYREAKIFHKFWIKPGSGSDLHALREHLTKHGIDLGGMSVAEGLKAVKNTRINGLVGLKQFTRQDGTMAEDNVITNFTTIQ